LPASSLPSEHVADLQYQIGMDEVEGDGASKQAFLPEVCITKLFALLCDEITLTESTCTESLSEASDPTFGQFPFILYNHKFICKQNIFDFFVHSTQIDRKTHTMGNEDK